MSASPPTREAVAVVLDVSKAMSADNFRLAKTVCANLVQQKLIFAPRDEVGLIFSGTNNTLNRMHTSSPNRYLNVTVAHPIIPSTLDVFKHLDNIHQEEGSSDMLEALLVAADHVYERTGDRKYQRRLFLVSNVFGTVKRKEDLSSLIQFMKQREMQLVVIGIDFSDLDAAPGQNDDWDRLSAKQQNERVAQFVCTELGEGSLVVPVNDAMEALTALRKRSVGQRSLCRCVLSIGDVRVAVHLFTKALQARIPTLKKTAAKGLVVEKKYFCVSEPDREIDPAVRVKAYRYGKSVIPFTDVDEAQLKFVSERSIQALGFIPLSQVPMHLLLGGVKVVASAPGDDDGAPALSALVQGMDQLQRAMLVRYVRVTNADPVLGVCIPSAKVERDILYLAILPFAEDLRHYRFTTYSDVVVLPEEAQAVDKLVHALTMDAQQLKPNATFNPTLQYYYQCVKERFLASVSNREAPSPTGLPEVSATVRRTCCHFGGPQSVVASLLSAAKAPTQLCAELFPFVDPNDDAHGGKHAKLFWFAKVAGVSDGSVKVEGLSKDAPTAASPLSASLFTPGDSPTPSDMQAAALLTGGAHADSKVTTSDPIGSFRSMLATKGVDNVDRAIFEMSEVILKLVRSSVGTQFYAKCCGCVDALRAACVVEGEPRAFNSFLINLMCALRGSDHEVFWTTHCLARGVRPITRLECADSDVADAAAADAFLAVERVAQALVEDDDGEEDLFGQLE